MPTFDADMARVIREESDVTVERARLHMKLDDILRKLDLIVAVLCPPMLPYEPKD